MLQTQHVTSQKILMQQSFCLFHQNLKARACRRYRHQQQPRPLELLAPRHRCDLDPFALIAERKSRILKRIEE